MDHVQTAMALASVPTPFLVFSLDKIEANIRRLRSYHVGVNFSVKSLYSREVLRFITPLVDALDIQSEWEASFVPSNASLSFHSPWLNECVLERPSLLQVSVNSLHQAQMLERIRPNLRWGCRVALSSVREEQFVAGPGKFGILEKDLSTLLLEALRNGRPCRFVHHHSVSRLSSADIAEELSSRFCDVLENLPNAVVDALDAVCLGGGLDSVSEVERKGLHVGEVIGALLRPLKSRFPHLRIALEPGRYIVEDACIAVTSVKEVRVFNDHTLAVVDLGTGFLIPLAAARFRFDVLGSQGDTFRKVDLVDGTCSPNGKIATELTGAHLEPGVRVVVLNCGSYTFSCAGPFHSPLPPLWIKQNGEFRCVANALQMIEASYAVLY